MHTHVEQPNPHHGHKQHHHSNQVEPVCWILDEAETALQQAPLVKVPDFAWVMLRLIRVPVTASRFGSEHELQQNESSWLAFSPSLSMPPLQAPRDDYLRGWADESGIFCCIPCRHSDQRLSNLDLMPACYIYEPRWMCLPEFYWWATGILETCSQFTAESIHPTLLKSPSSLHFTSNRHWE